MKNNGLVRMTSLCAAACVIAGVLFLRCTGTGGKIMSGGETANQFAVTVYLPEGQGLAVRAVVKFNVVNENTVALADTTDSLGRFTVDTNSLHAEFYNTVIELRKGTITLVSYNDSVRVSHDSLYNFRQNQVWEKDTLEYPASLTGYVGLEPQHSDKKRTVTVGVVGTDKAVNVDSSGMFIFKNMAGGTYNLKAETTLPDYTPTFRMVTLPPQTDLVLTDTIKLIYTGIPVVRGLMAFADSNGVVRLSWDSLPVCAKFRTYIVYRSEAGSAKLFQDTFVVHVPVFLDTVFSSAPRARQHSWCDPNDYKYEYWVTMQDLIGGESDFWQSCTLTVVSPVKTMDSLWYRNVCMPVVTGLGARFFGLDTMDLNGLLTDTMRLYSRALRQALPLAKIEYSDTEGIILATHACTANTDSAADTLVWKWQTPGIKKIIVRAYDIYGNATVAGHDTVTVRVYTRMDILRQASYSSSRNRTDRPVENCFDDSFVSDPFVSDSINPCTVTVAFPNPVSVSAVHVLVGEVNSQDLDNDDYHVEAADTVTDLSSQTGSYCLIVPLRTSVGGIWDFVPLSPAVSRKIFRFIVKRTIHDDYVHIGELQLLTLP